ncbi:hypothetical protein AVEN_63655-1 [Araneus ventricosus]|uniref:Uncharacterized protein n=1 Tax=Araneus ventricosus TaxID=182803 RepID=A0A4Y2C7B2_ARAVE|nr:hypothetical protein AVEN_63655-1 [Araneus ventricosus]
MTQHHAPCGSDCDVKHLPLPCCNCMQFHNFQKVSSFNRTALLHTTATLFVSFWIQHSPAVDRQGCCRGMTTTIPGHKAIRLLLVGLCEPTGVQRPYQQN